MALVGMSETTHVTPGENMTRRAVARRRHYHAAAAVLVALAGLVASGTTAHAAPFAALKQFKVPTSDSEPRAITNGSDGNRWFTEGTEFDAAPAKIARITPAGAITEFTPGLADGCNFCIITDIAQGPGGILYITSNDPTVMRFDVATLSFDTPVQMPNTSALGGDVAVGATDAWITDSNNDVVWRYHLADGQFTSFAVSDPGDVAVDPQGNAWFTQPGDVNTPGASNIGRIDAVTGAVTLTPTTDGSTTVAPRNVTVAADGQVWFTARFTPQAVGRLDPSSNTVTLFPLSNTGPSGIAASPDGSVWFTQETAGNAARISNAGVITVGKAVRSSGPFEITVAPDGNPWYTMMAANKIATLQLR
jgi:streptogramin lyase